MRYKNTENSGKVCKSLIFGLACFCKSLKILDAKKFSGVFRKITSPGALPLAIIIRPFGARKVVPWDWSDRVLAIFNLKGLIVINQIIMLLLLKISPFGAYY